MSVERVGGVEPETVTRRWRFYGVDKMGPGTSYYQGLTDAPEDTWVVEESRLRSVEEELRDTVLDYLAERGYLAVRDDDSEATR